MIEQHMVIPIQSPEGIKHLCYSERHITKTGGGEKKFYGKSLDQMSEEDATMVYEYARRIGPDLTEQAPRFLAHNQWFMNISVSLVGCEITVSHKIYGDIVTGHWDVQNPYIQIEKAIQILKVEAYEPEAANIEDRHMVTRPNGDRERIIFGPDGQTGIEVVKPDGTVLYCL